MIFAMSLLNSCAPNACCGGSSGVKTQQQQQVIWTNPQTKMIATERIIQGGAKFTGWCHCYYLSYGPWVDVRDKNGNDLHVIRCNDEAILNKLDVTNKFWDYNTGPAGIGGSGPAVVMMYPDGTLANVEGYPKYIESEFLVTHFYGKVLGKRSIQSDSVQFYFDLGKLEYKDKFEFKSDSADFSIKITEKVILDLK
jgi:hypothetical protein